MSAADKKHQAAGAAQQQQQKTKLPSPELAYSQKIELSQAHATDGSLLYQWNGQIWQPIDPRDAEREAFRWLGADPEYFTKATPKLAASCAQAAVINARKLPQYSNSQHVVLPLKNGYLHVRNDGSISLEPPDKRFGLSYLIDCDFDPAAQAPDFMQFLAEILPDPDVRRWVQSYVGYTLLPDCRFQKATFWLGGGANGKSTLAEIVAALHAKITALTIDSLDGFKLVSLIGASLVYVDETPSRIDEQELKKLISGGLVQIDRKFREPINLRPTAKWIICGNSLPALSDQSHGFWRRMPIVTFERQFAEHEQDPLLAKRIIETELGGVLLWALSGLTEIIKAGKLPPLPEAMIRAVDDGKRETNSVLAWFDDDRIEHDAAAWTPRAEIYRDYQQWARDRGYSPVNETKFWARLRLIEPQLVETTKRKIDGKATRGTPARLLHGVTAW
jgi:putative DNA primase/helicase